MFGRIRGKILYIVCGKDYADLYLEGEKGKHYFRVRDHDEYSGWYVVEEHRINRDGRDRVVRICSGPYREFDVDDFRDLITTLIIKPQPILADLTGQKTRIRKVEERCV